jgi:hypothetical protein
MVSLLASVAAASSWAASADQRHGGFPFSTRNGALSEDHGGWATNILDRRKASPVDMSFLNSPEKPAGKRGFLRAQKDQLVFEDGTPARFWGTNLTAYALFGTSRENVREEARRLSQLGFNLVRFVHHDSTWVNPNIFGDRNSLDTRQLNSSMLEKLDWWIKCLKEEGIYIWLDLHVGRQFKSSDGIENFEEISKGKPTASLFGYNYVNTSIQAAMKRFNESYLGHRNGFTGLQYKDEPAIAAVLITNENDLTHHFGNALLGDKGVPGHTSLYLAQVDVFAKKHQLSKDRVSRAWEPGPSKLFLNDLEHRFNVEMIQHLRTMGVKVPIVTTSTWGNPLSSLPALTAGDIIDVHTGGGAGELEKDPRDAANLVHRIAAAKIAGKPLSVTEWGVETRGALAEDRHAIPLYVASLASLQGWNAVMHYAYSQEPFAADRSTPSIYHAYNDPGMMATLPAAALLYRQGHVREATTIRAFLPGGDALFNKEISANTSIALRTAAELGKLMVVMPGAKELPWLEPGVVPLGAKIITEPRQSQLDVNATEVVSDTGELRRDWVSGVFTVNTPQTQAAMGRIGGKQIDLAEVEIFTTTRNASVAVQSLDASPIRTSRLILLSLGARSVPKAANELPFYSESVEGEITIRAPAGLRLYPLGGSAANGTQNRNTKASAVAKMQGLVVTYRAGQYRIRFSRGLQTYWLMLTSRPSSGAKTR